MLTETWIQLLLSVKPKKYLLRSSLALFMLWPSNLTLSLPRSLLVARVKLEPESSSSQVQKSIFYLFIFFSFDCDSCFHGDVPVVNSLRSNNSLVWDLDRSITSVILATIRCLLFKDMTTHSIYKFSWKNVTPICMKPKKRSHFHDTLSEKTDVNKY